LGGLHDWQLLAHHASFDVLPSASHLSQHSMQRPTPGPQWFGDQQLWPLALRYWPPSEQGPRLHVGEQVRSPQPLGQEVLVPGSHAPAGAPLHSLS
jgi:hypothetical protein